MGNHASTGGRPKPGEQYHGTGKVEGQAFMFDRKIISQHSEEDPVPVLPSKSERKDSEDVVPPPPKIRPVLTSKEKMLPCIIKWKGGGQDVSLAGTFNQWQNLTMVKSEEDFIAIVDLPKGKHEYKFLVDGEWKTDPKGEKVENLHGTENNYISVDQADFEELENTLLKDPNDPKFKDNTVSTGKAASTPAPAVKSPDVEDEYSQEIPEFQINEKTRNPPMLPAHLLQVILNKDTPVSIEPTLLPEPNHVMLNHMYALSIKDGLMVLSTSHRYKKKCVTTLIYRPI